MTKQEEAVSDSFSNPDAGLSNVNLNTDDRGTLLAARLSVRLVDAILTERGLGRFGDVQNMQLRLAYRLGDHYELLEELQARANILSI